MIKHLRKLLVTSTTVAVAGIIAASLTASCTDGNSTGAITVSLENVTLSGEVLMPDNVTPLAGATVYIPAPPGSTGIELPENLTCEVPDVNVLAVTCTNPDGTFTLNITGEIDEDSITIFIEKADFTQTVEVEIDSEEEDIGEVAMPADPEEGAAKIAVVTGWWDHMENLLAKLGFGEIDEHGELVPGTEKFDLYDGTFSTEYPAMSNLFEDNDGDGNPDIYNYDIVFINCGTDYEYDVLSNDTRKGILKNYVEIKGGTLYVTDLSYDYVEQVFPEYIDFYGDDTSINSAEVGVAGIEVNAAIKDDSLESWLGNVTCVDESGNETSCLNPDGTVHIGGFLGGWAVINGTESTETKIWVEGTINTYYETDVLKPLTVSFTAGNGTVIYSSYHTEETSTTGFLPQERILQYLVFER